jgi:hypothetical protein
MYLALIPALFVSEGLGGAISKRLTTSFVLIAFKRACALGRPSNDIFAHTNSSSQHATHLFRQMRDENNPLLSIIRLG